MDNWAKLLGQSSQPGLGAVAFRYRCFPYSVVRIISLAASWASILRPLNNWYHWLQSLCENGALSPMGTQSVDKALLQNRENIIGITNKVIAKTDNHVINDFKAPWCLFFFKTEKQRNRGMEVTCNGLTYSLLQCPESWWSCYPVICVLSDLILCQQPESHGDGSLARYARLLPPVWVPSGRQFRLD